MDFRERLKRGVVVFDGAMGTQIHEIQPTEEDYRGMTGCSEILNLTLPEKIQAIHERYLAAGADVIETNTFGANRIVLEEYGIAGEVENMNRVAVELARRAVEKFSGKPRYVAGSMGPGTKIASLGHTTYDILYDSYFGQAQAMVQGGVDLFMIETCQDPLQIKAAIHAVRDAQEKAGVDLPIVVSVTVETTGTLLVGTEIGAVIAILSPFEIDVLGMNCATGPDRMGPYVRQLCKQFQGPVLVMPNAGLPQNVDGKMVYTLEKERFVEKLVQFVQEDGVGLVGGCCGTTPEFIELLAEKVEGLEIGARRCEFQPSVASLFSAQAIAQSPSPLFIGERANTNGSKQFREYLLKGDWDGILSIALEQQKTGAHTMDLCVAYTGRDEVADMKEAVSRIGRQVGLPLVIDSTELRVLEAALKLYGGRPIINSINLESGEERADNICRLAKRYGAALIALTIDEKGMAMDTARKLEIAGRIYDIAVHRHGLKPHDLIFDLLTFTLGSGDVSLKNAGKETLDGMRLLKQRLPGVFTTLGVSNISFGLSPYSREVLNSVFMAEAVKAGLDTAIVHVSKISPLCNIPPEDRIVAENLLYNRGEKDPLFTFLEHFQQKGGKKKKGETAASSSSLEERIKQCVVGGTRFGLESLLLEKLKETRGIDLINQVLIPAMKNVGELFATGEMQLPFVLQSAEVMKFAVDKIQPYLEKSDGASQTSIVLATVRGDVHDIGKNLVDIILSNNGYKVYNLGIKCEIDAMLKKAQEVKADAIGMSGLLVKSTVVMKENLEEMRRRGIAIPVLLGGAALTRSYVDQVCVPLLEAPVLYCEDAFAGLKAVKCIQEGSLEAFAEANREKYRGAAFLKRKENVPVAGPEPLGEAPIPTPPFWGRRVVQEISLDEIYPCLSEEVLFRGRWGYRGRNISGEAYGQLIETRVRPEFEALKQKCKEERLFTPRVVYGYYPCNGEGQEVVVYRPGTEEEWTRLRFPRQKESPHRCIADFFCPKTSGKKDVIALQVVTIGEKAQQISQELFRQDRYKEYLLFHGLSVESTEALAEYWHRLICKELGILQEEGISDFVVQRCRGSRYSFGYPACPDMEENGKLFQILSPEEIGVSLTESGQMVPEQTTSAFVVHHPQAKY